MKSKWIAISILIAANTALAADGNITITGEITGTTCAVSGGSGAPPGAGSDFSIVLDKVQTSALSAIGQVAGSKPFFIQIGDASCTAGSAAVLFESTSPAVNRVSGNLINLAASGATNVEVRIVDLLANKEIHLGLGGRSTVATLVSGVATLPFAAQYIAVNGPATAGPVETGVQYSVTFP